ncbi:hypothetical protein [Chryseobacterium sp. CH21]|uniref:hypothetical protein n=1 Tax=Chryseobacterium sp. CH21 TaxID=713556 RepID=UPI00100A3FF4|nr:hypothetical protein [Chryseobacterium sp. CH21]
MMKNTNQIFHCLFLLLILSCNKKQSKQNVEKVYSERIEDWILPQRDNFLWFDYKFYDKGGVDFEMKRKVYYIKSDSSNFGTLEAVFMNNMFVSGEQFLFRTSEKDKCVYLLKSKKSLTKSSQTKEYESLIYFQFPADSDTLRWSYSKNDGIFNCSSFWLLKEGKEKELVVVREAFLNDGSRERFEKDIEYYQKHKGLVKISMFGSKDNLIMTQNVSKRGFDPDAKSNSFSWATSQNKFSNERKESLAFLKEFDGKYSYEVKLLENSVLKGRLINLLGNEKYNFMKETWGVEGGIIVENSMFNASGCEQHNCDMTNFIIAVDFRKDLLYVGYRVDGEVQLFGEDNNYPNELMEFEKQY